MPYIVIILFFAAGVCIFFCLFVLVGAALAAITKLMR